MDAREIIQFWGLENLKRWPHNAVQELAIPEASKRFLSEVGLPVRQKDAAWLFRFEGDLTRLPEKNNYIRFGFFDTTPPLCIDEERGGCVVRPGDKWDIERFFNSSIERFAEFLVIFVRYLEKAKPLYDVAGDLDVDKCKQLLSEVKGQMRRIDAAAFENAESYWAVWIEDLRYPLMSDEELDALDTDAS